MSIKSAGDDDSVTLGSDSELISTETDHEMDFFSTNSNACDDDSSLTLGSDSELISTETDHEMELLNSGLERLSTGSNDDLD